MLGHAAVLGRTDAGGSFRLPHAVGPDVSHGNLLFAVAQAGIGWCRFEPSKRRSDTADLVVRLQPTGALRVVVLDAAGSPRAGVGVRAFPRFAPLGIENRAMPFGPAAEPACSFFHGRTDSSGVARLPLLPIGEAGFMRGRGTNERAYDLCLHADGYPAQPLLPCEVQPGAEVEVVARLVAARHVTVTAVVRDDAGAAIAHAAVEVRGDRTVRGKTDATGRAEFVIGGAPTVFVSATSDSHRSVQEQPFAIGSDAGFLTANLVLPRACPLDGVVVDQHGEPLPGAPLYLDRSPEAYTDGQGRFHIAEFPVGEHTLRVAPPAMDPTEWTGKQEPEVVDAARGPVRIVMQRRSGRADVRVAIVDTRSGEVLEPTDTVLRLFDVGQGRYLQRKNLRTEGGAVAADATPAGKWRLDVVTATGHRGSLTFELDETQRTCDLRLPLEPPGTLTGRVQFTGVAASGRVVVRVQHAVPDPHAYRRYRYAGRWVADAASQCVLEQQFGGTGDLTLQPASNPTFRLERVDPDQDLVLRATGDGVAGELTVRVAPGGTSDVVLEVRPKGRY
jgi:hypothetical protein